MGGRVEYIKKCLTNLTFVLILLASYSASAEDIAVATFSLDTRQVDMAIRVMQPIYKRIGYDMSVVRFPGKRSLVEANKGTTQAELVRIRVIEEDYPNLIRVPYAIGSIKVIAITKNDRYPINQQSDMLDKRVGILRGVEVFDTLTQGFRREVVNDIDSLFELLLSGRVDLILFPDSGVQKYVKGRGLSKRVNVGDQAILELPLYHFVHKDEYVLAKKLTKEMQAMKESGELEQLINSAE